MNELKLEYPGVEGNGEIYLDVLRAICGETAGKSMVDLGCYHAPYTPQLGFGERWYVDIQARPLDFKEEQRYFLQEDVMFFLQTTHRVYDTLIASDLIEHLSYFDGGCLISLMEQKAKRAIIFTPLGPCNITLDGHPDSHRSGWLIEDFVGWASIVFPDFHPKLNIGAFFSFKCDDLINEFDRIKNEINNFKWSC